MREQRLRPRPIRAGSCTLLCRRAQFLPVWIASARALKSPHVIDTQTGKIAVLHKIDDHESCGCIRAKYWRVQGNI